MHDSNFALQKHTTKGDTGRNLRSQRGKEFAHCLTRQSYGTTYGFDGAHVGPHGKVHPCQHR